jgi:hypothetical protein
MTAREKATLIEALDCWRKDVAHMTPVARDEAALADLIVRDDELEALRGKIERAEIQ